jgi:nicotinamidase/pyrazinamidase
MKQTVFLDIDTQYDFMNPKGKLYVKDAKDIIPNLRKLTAFAEKHKITIISSLDVHTKNDPEFKMFPAHCVKKSPGAAKIKETRGLETRQLFIPKHTFDVFSNPKTKQILSKFKSAFVYGVALDYCVKAACLGLVDSGIKTYLVKDATKAVSPKTGSQTLRLLKSKGINFINTKELIERMPLWKKE